MFEETKYKKTGFLEATKSEVGELWQLCGFGLGDREMVVISTQGFR